MSADSCSTEDEFELSGSFAFLFAKFPLHVASILARLSALSLLRSLCESQENSIPPFATALHVLHSINRASLA